MIHKIKEAEKRNFQDFARNLADNQNALNEQHLANIVNGNYWKCFFFKICSLETKNQ